MRQLMSEYDPHPPFNAGSMKTAPAEVKAPMVQMLAEFRKKAEELASSNEGLGEKISLRLPSQRSKRPKIWEHPPDFPSDFPD